MAARKQNIVTLTPALVAEALLKSHGIVSHAARTLKCSRRTIYNYIDQHAEVKAAFDEAREAVIDELEEAFLQRVRSGDTKAIIFGLQTIGAKRGYIPHQHLQTSGEGVRVIVAFEDESEAENG